MSIILYQAVNLINGKRYIGISKIGLAYRERRHRYTASRNEGCRLFGNALRKYGESILFSVLAICPDLAYAKEAEKRAIAVYRPEYNATNGGDGVWGLRHSKESRAKMAAAKAGKPQYKFTAEDMLRSQHTRKIRGVRATPENIQKMILARRKPVRCLTDRMEFKSLTEAAKFYNTKVYRIREYCLGLRKSRRGLRFEYIEAA